MLTGSGEAFGIRAGRLSVAQHVGQTIHGVFVIHLQCILADSMYGEQSVRVGLAYDALARIEATASTRVTTSAVHDLRGECDDVFEPFEYHHLLGSDEMVEMKVRK